MPFGIIARCVQFIQFSVAIVRRMKMARRKPDDMDSTGDPSKEKKEKVKEVKKRPPRKKDDRKMIEKAVEEYRKDQGLVMKVTYTELAEKYQIPASTVRGYQSKDPSGTMPVKPAVMGSVCWNWPMRKSWSITCCSAVIGVMGRTAHK